MFNFLALCLKIKRTIIWDSTALVSDQGNVSPQQRARLRGPWSVRVYEGLWSVNTPRLSPLSRPPRPVPAQGLLGQGGGGPWHRRVYGRRLAPPYPCLGPRPVRPTQLGDRRALGARENINLGRRRRFPGLWIGRLNNIDVRPGALETTGQLNQNP